MKVSYCAVRIYGGEGEVAWDGLLDMGVTILSEGMRTYFGSGVGQAIERGTFA